jgi:hypothetical protein
VNEHADEAVSVAPPRIAATCVPMTAESTLPPGFTSIPRSEITFDALTGRIDEAVQLRIRRERATREVRHIVVQQAREDDGTLEVVERHPFGFERPRRSASRLSTKHGPCLACGTWEPHTVLRRCTFCRRHVFCSLACHAQGYGSLHRTACLLITETRRPCSYRVVTGTPRDTRDLVESHVQFGIPPCVHQEAVQLYDQDGERLVHVALYAKPREVPEEQWQLFKQSRSHGGGYWGDIGRARRRSHGPSAPRAGDSRSLGVSIRDLQRRPDRGLLYDSDVEGPREPGEMLYESDTEGAGN